MLAGSTVHTLVFPAASQTAEVGSVIASRPAGALKNTVAPRSAQRYLQVVQGHLDGKGTGDRVCAGGNFIHLGRQPLSAAPKLDLDRLAFFDRSHFVLKHGKNHIAGAILCQTHDGHAGTDHLPDFCVHPGDHPGLVSNQFAVTQLIALARVAPGPAQVELART